MHRLAVEAWAQETSECTAPSRTTPRVPASNQNPLRKRKRDLEDINTNASDSHIMRTAGPAIPNDFSDPDKCDRTPRWPAPGPPDGSARPLSSVANAYRTTASLGTLRRPMCLVKIKDGRSVPADAKQLYDKLLAVSFNVATLPNTLKGIMSHSALADAGIQPFMWQPAGNGQPADESAVEHEYARILTIIDSAVDSANVARSEAAWNVQIHYPILRELTSGFRFAKVETITSA